MRSEIEFDRILLDLSLNSAKRAGNSDVAKIFRDQAKRIQKRINIYEKEQVKKAEENKPNKNSKKRKGKI